MRMKCVGLAAAAGLLALTAGAARAQTAAEMTFFVASAGSGKGADLGGLAGADAICQRLAQAVGAGGKTWRAYLSTQAAGGTPAVNARDRIGAGPWRNAKGAVVASSVADLHGGAANLTKQTALNEKGEPVNGRGDTPNMHDILTGSQADGTAFGPGEDRTCGNYTKSGAEGAVMLGHHDRSGLDDSAAAKSWNTSHLSRGGCSQDALKSTGGAGLLYCFASN
ncbi:hypothetical protein [Bosea thiooxidans]